MAAPVQKDQEVDLKVESLAYGGNGVARLDGYVVFVRRGLPGDTVRARITKVKRNHAEALAVESQSGLRMIALTTFVTYAWPVDTSPGGCSLTAPFGVIHETAGSVPFFAAVKKSLIGVTSLT